MLLFIKIVLGKSSLSLGHPNKFNPWIAIDYNPNLGIMWQNNGPLSVKVYAVWMSL